MNYTDKEIEIIKQNAYDKGTVHGTLITIIIFMIGQIIVIYS